MVVRSKTKLILSKVLVNALIGKVKSWCGTCPITQLIGQVELNVLRLEQSED